MSKISIKQVKQIREDLRLTHLVIYGLSSDGAQHIATHGKSTADAKHAAEMGNEIKQFLNWPENMCKAKPLPRICENCEFWQRKQISHSERIPENWPGKCMYNPEPIIRYAQDISCGNFTPNV